MSVPKASKKYGVPLHILYDGTESWKPYKQYSQDDFQAAMEEVAKGGIIWPFVILESNLLSRNVCH